MSTPREDGAPATVRLRVKSKTGDVYVRAGRHWRADKWTSVELPLDVALRLRDDPWIDVRELAEDAPVDPEHAPPDRSALEQQLADAHAALAALEERLRVVESGHARDLEQLREAHARELSAITATATRQASKRAP